MRALLSGPRRPAIPGGQHRCKTPLPDHQPFYDCAYFVGAALDLARVAIWSLCKKNLTTPWPVSWLPRSWHVKLTLLFQSLDPTATSHPGILISSVHEHIHAGLRSVVDQWYTQGLPWLSSSPGTTHFPLCAAAPLSSPSPERCVRGCAGAVAGGPLDPRRHGGPPARSRAGALLRDLQLCLDWVPARARALGRRHQWWARCQRQDQGGRLCSPSGKSRCCLTQSGRDTDVLTSSRLLCAAAKYCTLVSAYPAASECQQGAPFHLLECPHACTALLDWRRQMSGSLFGKVMHSHVCASCSFRVSARCGL